MTSLGTAWVICNAKGDIEYKSFTSLRDAWSVAIHGVDIPAYISGYDECVKLMKSCGWTCIECVLVPKDQIEEVQK